MATTMSRGKQQILFNYLPGRTFDFERGPISRIVEVRGLPQTDLNETIVIRKIAEQARAWAPAFRPALGDHVLADPGRFVLLDPVEAEAEMFPKVFWCQNHRCGRVLDASKRDELPNGKCPTCREGTLAQLRFIKIHRCGALEPLTPPACPQCHHRDMALDTRGSERISAFRWVCRSCESTLSLFPGTCQHCLWPDKDATNGKRDRLMQIEVHRAGRTFFPQTTVLLNIPHREFQGFFSRADWQLITAAKFLGVSGFSDQALSGYDASRGNEANAISAADLDAIMESGGSPEAIIERLKQLRGEKFGPGRDEANLSQTIAQKTGVPSDVWERAGPELLEALMPFENRRAATIVRGSQQPELSPLLGRSGLGEIALAQDYTILNASFGFSRSEYSPDQCWLNPFPADQHYQGRLPVFVDRVQADALLASLDPQRVIRWLRVNGLRPQMPAGSDPSLAARAYFVKLFDEASLYHTLAQSAEQRMVFGLLHSLSHLCIRQAALLCGLEKTSLSEYVLPKALTFAIYCNHRFGATIGALTALFEQTLAQWLTGVHDSRACVYDPVCSDHGANCHACTHLPETSCRFFNLNLSRAFLFGGPDAVLGTIPHGYFLLPGAP